MESQAFCQKWLKPPTACEEEFVNKLLDLVKDVWEKGCTPCAWRDSILVLIPKKGDLSNYIYGN